MLTSIVAIAVDNTTFAAACCCFPAAKIATATVAAVPPPSSPLPLLRHHCNRQHHLTTAGQVLYPGVCQVHGGLWRVRGQARTRPKFVKAFQIHSACPGFVPRFCGKGLCTASSFYDRTLEGGWGARWTSLLPNQFETEEPESLLACACDEGVAGDSCDVGVCAAVSCNEPFGGFCNETGVCTCINGYHGEHCSISPELDQFGFLHFLCDTKLQTKASGVGGIRLRHAKTIAVHILSEPRSCLAEAAMRTICRCRLA